MGRHVNQTFEELKIFKKKTKLEGNASYRELEYIV